MRSSARIALLSAACASCFIVVACSLTNLDGFSGGAPGNSNAQDASDGSSSSLNDAASSSDGGKGLDEGGGGGADANADVDAAALRWCDRVHPATTAYCADFDDGKDVSSYGGVVDSNMSLANGMGVDGSNAVVSTLPPTTDPGGVSGTIAITVDGAPTIIHAEAALRLNAQTASEDVESFVVQIVGPTHHYDLKVALQTTKLLIYDEVNDQNGANIADQTIDTTKITTVTLELTTSSTPYHLKATVNGVVIFDAATQHTLPETAQMSKLYYGAYYGAGSPTATELVYVDNVFFDVTK